MAGNSGSIKIEIVVGNDGAIKGINQVVNAADAAGKQGAKSFDGFNTTLGETGTAAGGAKAALLSIGGAVVGVLGLQQGLAMLKNEAMASLKASSDLQETSSKFGVVFAGQQQVAEGWAKTLVDSYGMSTREAKQYLGAMQDLLVPMGMNSVAAGKMSNDVVKLSADLGSFNNLPTAQVMDDMQSALVGNYETMKKYGVVLNESRVSQEAMNMGLASSKDALTAADKAQAAYKLIVEGSTNAVGDMIRTGDGYANQLKKAQANVEDLRSAVGDGLLPVASLVLAEFNKWSKSTLGNRDALVDLSRDGVVVLLKGISGVIYGVQAFHDVWLTARMASTGAVAAIANSLDFLYDGLRLILAPIDAIMIGLKAIGMISANPFDTMRDSLKEFADVSVLVFEDTVDNARNANNAYSKIHTTIDGVITGIEGLGQASTQAADATVAALTAGNDKIVKETEGAAKQRKKTEEDITKWNLEQLRLRTEGLDAFYSWSEKEQDEFNAAEIAKKKKTDEEILKSQLDTLAKMTDGLDAFYTWSEAEAKEDAEARIREQRHATDIALRYLGEGSETAVKIRREENRKILANANLTAAERKELEKRLNEEDVEIQRQANIKKLKDSERTYDMAKGYAMEHFDWNKDETQHLTEAWIRGEDLKVSATGMAKDKLIGFASNLASSYFERLYEGIVNEIGAWLGLGAASSSTLGDTWQDKLGSVAGYLAGIGIAMAGAREISGYAQGGWLGANPNGGMINQGSGYRDDVFLGFTGGGSTANYGMGGEFVINKAATARHKDLLYAINSNRYADGGPVGEPAQIANDVNGAGFGTFVEEWANSGDWKAAVKQAIIYYAGAFAGAIGGKELGPGFISGFANGGIIRARGFGFGDFLSDAWDDITHGSTMPGLGMPTGEDIWNDPFGLAMDNNITRAVTDFQKSLGISGMDGSLSGLAAQFWGADFWGAMAQIRDSVDAHLIPFYTDILTPGASLDFAAHPEKQIEGIFNSILDHPEGLLGLMAGGQLPAYAAGTPYVPRTGLALVHEGEKITPAWANQEHSDLAAEIRELREEIAPLLFVVASNAQKATSYLDNWENNGLPETRV